MEGILCTAIIAVAIILINRRGISLTINHNYKQELPPPSPEAEEQRKAQEKLVNEYYEQQKKAMQDVVVSINNIMGVTEDDGGSKANT